MQLRYKQTNLWDTIQYTGGVIETHHICFADAHQVSDDKKQLFTPIGSFLGTLLEMLAWEDPSLRSLAEYFILAELLGSGKGRGRMWYLDILSDTLVGKLRQDGCLISGKRWHEWSLGF
jgi:hypothetical protein